MVITRMIALSMMDVQRLARDPSPAIRAELAGKIAGRYAAGQFTISESEIATEILRLLATDIEVQVRKSLAHALSQSMQAPHDVIMRLASDVSEVAVPVLQYSYVLTEEDLIAIVKSTRELVKLVTIAKRETISSELSEALMETAEHKVLHTLLCNRGAMIGEESLNKRWEQLTGSASLLEAMVHRGGLPVTVAEKLFTLVSDEMRQHLAREYKLPMAVVAENMEDIREWATLGMLMPEFSEDGQSELEIEHIVHQLYTSNRLTYSLIIRALCTGDLHFFEAAMARLSGVPRANARILMFDSGPLGFKAFYAKARLPEGFYEAIRALLKISLEATQYGRLKREDFRRHVVERIHNEGLGKKIENMEYMLSIIGGSGAGGHHYH